MSGAGGETPTTEEVRRGYAETIDALGGRHLGFDWFDRWFAAERAKAKAEALREASDGLRAGPRGSKWCNPVCHEADQIELQMRATRIEREAVQAVTEPTRNPHE